MQGPWHAVLYDVVTGALVRGPQGASFAPLAAPSRQRPRALKTFPVEVHGGAVWLVG
jgi:nitrite reductase/ring-hydroxylating ferredoxin subunit